MVLNHEWEYKMVQNNDRSIHHYPDGKQKKLGLKIGLKYSRSFLPFKPVSIHLKIDIGSLRRGSQMKTFYVRKIQPNENYISLYSVTGRIYISVRNTLQTCRAQIAVLGLT